MIAEFDTKPDTGFTFIEDTHSYFLNGIQIPSVSFILDITGISAPSEFTTEYDMWVGSAAHKAIELYIKHDLDMKNLDHALRPRVEAYKKFEKATRFKPYPDLCERPQFNELWQYGYTPDIVGEFPDASIGVIDIKSGGILPSTAIQTAAYSHGLQSQLEAKMQVPISRWGLTIGKHGNPRLKEFTDDNDSVVWQNCLSNFNWIRNSRKIKLGGQNGN